MPRTRNVREADIMPASFAYGLIGAMGTGIVIWATVALLIF